MSPVLPLFIVNASDSAKKTTGSAEKQRLRVCHNQMGAPVQQKTRLCPTAACVYVCVPRGLSSREASKAQGNHAIFPCVSLRDIIVNFDSNPFTFSALYGQCDLLNE